LILDKNIFSIMENLQTTYLGLKLRNPLIAGSCGLTNSVSNIKELAKKGVGAIVVKSLFEEQIQIEAEKVIKNDTDGVSIFNKAPDTLLSKRIYDYEEAYSYIYDFAKRNTLGKYLSFLEEAKKSVDIPLMPASTASQTRIGMLFQRKLKKRVSMHLSLIFIFFHQTGEEAGKTMRRSIMILSGK
jgi:dihydroorotate dehydrogenase (fumarate)